MADKNDFTLTKKQEEAFDALRAKGGDTKWIDAEDIGLMYALEALEKVGVVQITEKDDKVYVAQAGILMGPPGQEDAITEAEEAVETEKKDIDEPIPMMPSDWREFFSTVKGIGSSKIDGILEAMKEREAETLGALNEMDLETLPSVGESTADKILDAAVLWRRKATQTPERAKSLEKLKKLRRMQRTKKLEESKQ